MYVLLRVKLVALLSFMCLFSILTGCGNRMGTVQGEVTFDGQPIERGTISFESVEEKGVRSGAAIEDGKYQAREVVPGEKIVRIMGQRKTGRKISLRAMAPPGAPVPSEPIDEYVEFIPSIYNTQSELTAEVTSGSNQMDFPLKSK